MLQYSWTIHGKTQKKVINGGYLCWLGHEEVKTKGPCSAEGRWTREDPKYQGKRFREHANSRAGVLNSGIIDIWARLILCCRAALYLYDV